MNSLSEALRAELRGSGVIVTAVCPGPVGLAVKLAHGRWEASLDSVDSDVVLPWATMGTEPADCRTFRVAPTGAAWVVRSGPKRWYLWPYLSYCLMVFDPGLLDL